MICIKSNEEVCGRNLLRYGKIISDRKLDGKNCVRVREIVLSGKKYFHYMVNGEVKDIVYVGDVEVHRFYYSQKQREMMNFETFMSSFVFFETIIFRWKKKFYPIR